MFSTFPLGFPLFTPLIRHLAKKNNAAIRATSYPSRTFATEDSHPTFAVEEGLPLCVVVVGRQVSLLHLYIINYNIAGKILFFPIFNLK